MRVDDPRAHFNLPVTPAADVQNEKTPVVRRGVESFASKDAVSLSSDLRLADEAVRAAALAGDVRPEAVARARALLASGELGADLTRLANRLIESLSESCNEPS